jgi:sigma-E factor negative regulatory protein RseA
MMKPEELTNRELVSALADGQLRGAEFVRAVALASQDGDAAAAWHAYHVVGEILRVGEVVASADDQKFLARFDARLAQEEDSSAKTANIESATEYIANSAYSTRASGRFDQINLNKDSANQPIYRWKFAAAVASLAAVGAIGWNVLGNSSGGGETLSSVSPPAQVAQVVPAAITEAQLPQVMIRDPHLDALLAAHKQFGGTSALQMPAGFIRNATFEGGGR